MKATYDAKAKTLTITIKCETPRPSSTGKMDLIYTSGGFKPVDVEIAGRMVRANVTLGHYATER